MSNATDLQAHATAAQTNASSSTGETAHTSAAARSLVNLLRSDYGLSHSKTRLVLKQAESQLETGAARNGND